MQHVAVALTVFAVFAAVACTHTIEATHTQSEALAMRQATEKAQATLDEFLVKAQRLPAGTKAYAVRVGVQEGRDTEYFWVDEFSWSDGTFLGRINDEPRLVKNIKPGQMHRFSRLDIVDWTYTDENSGKTFGNFTACLPSSQQPPVDGSKVKRGKDLGCS